MSKFKFRKAMNVSFVLIPIMMFSISIPMFYLSYTTKHANNTKKMLQEAAYSGALAGTYALDIKGFENGKEKSDNNPSGVDSVNGYPNDVETGGPASFMIQTNRLVRRGTNFLSDNANILGGTGVASFGSNSKDRASAEIVKAVDAYLESNLKISSNSSSPSDVNSKSYSKGDYTIDMKFERDGLKYPNGVSANAGTGGPYNKVTVSVSLRYKPIMYKSLFKDGEGKNRTIPIYGTSSAKTKTIR